MAKNTTVKGLLIELGIDVKGFNSGIRSTKGEITSLQKDINALNKLTKFDATNIIAYKSQLEKLGNVYDNQKKLVELYNDKIDALDNAIAGAKSKIASLTDEYGENSDEVKKAQSILASLEKQLDKTTKTRDREEISLEATKQGYVQLQSSIESLTNSAQENASTTESAIKAVRENIRLLDESFSSLNPQTKFDSSKVEAYSKQIDILSEKMRQQETLVNLYDEQLGGLNTEFEEARSNLVRLEGNVNSSNTEIAQARDLYDQLYSQINQVNHQRDLEENSLKTTSLQYDSLTKKVNGLSGELGGLDSSASQANGGVDRLAQSSERLDSATSYVSDKINALDVALGNLISETVQEAIQKLGQLATQVYTIGTGFEDATAELASVLEISKYSGTIQELSEYFQELSLNSRYSAEEITRNASILANAGYSADQIKASIEAINNLALGTGESFETMANVTVDGLAAMGYSANEAQHFVDVLAKSAIATNTDVTQMGEALQYVGSVAGTMGYSVEDVTIALGAMATQGVKSTSAGTALRSMITRLAVDTSDARTTIEGLGVAFFDAEGHARPLGDVLSDLRDVTKGMTDEQKTSLEYTIAGQRGLTGLSAILNTTDEDWQKLTDTVNDYNGTVDKMVNTRMDTMSGDVDKLKNTWQGLANTMYDQLEPSLRRAAKSLTSLMKNEAFQADIENIINGIADAIDWLAETMDNSGGSIIDFAATIGEMMLAFAGTSTVTNGVLGLAGGIKNLVSSVKNGKTFTDFIGALASNTGVVGTVAGIAATGITLLAQSMVNATNNAIEYIDSMYQFDPITQGAIDKTTELVDTMNTLHQSTLEQNDSIIAEYSSYESLIKQYDSLIDANGKVKAGYEERAMVILEQLAPALGMETNELQSQIDKYGTLQEAIGTTLELKKAQAILDSGTQEYTEALAKQVELENQRVIMENQLTTSKQKLAEQQEKVNKMEESYNTLVKNNSPIADEYKTKLDQEVVTLGSLQGNYDELTNKIETNRTEYEALQNTISDYEGLSSAIVEGDVDKIKAALDDYMNKFKTASDSSVEELADQYRESDATLQQLEAAFKSGQEGITQEMVDEAKTRRSMSADEYGKALKDAGTFSDDYVDELVKGLKDGTGSIGDAAKNIIYSASEEFRKGQSSFFSSMSYAGDGAVKGLNSKLAEVKLAAQEIGRVANKALNVTLQVHSPSKVTEETGKYFDEGLIKGMEQRMRAVQEMAGNVGEEAEKSLRSASFTTTGAVTNQTNSYDNSSFSPVITVNVYSKAGESDRDFAKRIADQINKETTRLKNAW